MSTPISSNAPPLPATRSTLQTRGDERVAAATQPAEQEAAAGVQVTFSDAMRERMVSMRRATSALRAHSEQASEARKQQARERIEQIRERIKMLKMLVASMGGMAPKSVLREIEQLARSLGQAASVLKEGSGSASSSSAGNVGGVTIDGAEGGDTDAAAAQAAGEGGSATVVAPVAESAEPVEAVEDEGPTEAEAAQLKSEAAGAEAEASAEETQAGEETEGTSAARGGDDREQRRADAELIRKAVNELKALLALMRASVPVDDEESKKTVKRIEEQISVSEKAAQSLALGSVSSIDGGLAAAVGSISISV